MRHRQARLHILLQVINFAVQDINVLAETAALIVFVRIILWRRSSHDFRSIWICVVPGIVTRPPIEGPTEKYRTAAGYETTVEEWSPTAKKSRTATKPEAAAIKAAAANETRTA